MFTRLISIAAIVFCLTTPAVAQQYEGDYLYQVTTVRAAPGKLADLLDWIAAMKASGYFEEAGEHPPMVMRHSQGDQWDLLKIAPMGSWGAYHAKRQTNRRAKAQTEYIEQLKPGLALVAFAEDHFAYGPPLAEIESAFADNAFFHIEMFKAAPGKAGGLMEQRRMENTYLGATGQTRNMIFQRAAGSDVDVFTIGFHASLKAFAADAPVTDEEKQAAAIAAGFQGRADISFYLRSLISAHHDTLAVKVE